MNLHSNPKRLRLRRTAQEQLGFATDPASNSDLLEALLYLRRASELLIASRSSQRAAFQIDRTIAELRDAIRSARGH